jgi:signal transduction histidine kinase
MSGRFPLTTHEIRYEQDVVLARQRARQVAAAVGLDTQEQARVATAVSELARNAFQYAGGGKVEFWLVAAGGRGQLTCRVVDAGPGIADVEGVLAGRVPSQSGLGLGLAGARRLADAMRVESTPGGGTVVELAKLLPAGTVASAELAERVGAELARRRPSDPIDEIREQNQELLRTLEALRARQAEVERLNSELEETNRGVLALYAELDDRALELKRLSEVKSRFLSDIGHELRTPLASMVNLARVLLDRTDGDLTPEQDRQVSMIRRAADGAVELVNDLLDLSRIESGRVQLRPAEFTVHDLFAGLRGLVRPLVNSDAVTLTFEEVGDIGALHTDEQRLSQVLRNFLSNAIKFTERGEIRVRALAEPGDMVRFEVEDTGIGIAPADHDRIFEDFEQVDSPRQRKVTGTGLGLPLTRKLAALLGGSVQLRSVLGAGATFAVVVPRVLPGEEGATREATVVAHA